MVNISAIEWRPPCGCVMIYEYDNDLPLASRTITCTAVTKTHPEHPAGAAGGNQQHHDQVLKESRKVHWTLGGALDALPAQLAETDPESGSLVLKKGITFNWSFSGTFPNRVCTVSFTGVTLTTQQKNTLQNKANQLFGTGQVIVQ